MKKQTIKISYVSAKVAFISCLITGCPLSAIITLLVSGILYSNL